MSSSFQNVKFLDVVHIITERIPVRDADVSTYVSTDNMVGNLGGVTEASQLPKSGSVTTFNENDVLFSNIRTYFRKVWLADHSGSCSLDVLVFRTGSPDILDQRYLHWIVCSQNFIEYTNLTAKGAKMPRGDKNAIGLYELKLPELSKQKSIATLLDNIALKITNNSQINQTLESISQALFKSWFVDFDPVKAKIAVLEVGGSEEEALVAAMQVISSKNAEELAAFEVEKPEEYAELRETAELFPAAMVGSELGEIPEGWVVSEIGDEVVAVGGGTPSTKISEYWADGNINWTTPRDLSGLPNKILIETDRKITESGLAKISSGLLPVNTVLMSSRAPVGYLALAKIPVAVNQGYVAMKCEKVLTPEYVIQWCVANMDEIKNRASGTTFAEISKTSFRIIPVIVPSKNLLSIYSQKAKKIYEKIEQNVLESKSLVGLRDTLLSNLLSGELQVPEMRIEVEL